MNHENIVEFIGKACVGDVDFPTRVKNLLSSLGELSISQLNDHLAVAGFIPEIFSHDSTEEKMYAKYCDILIFGCLEQMGLEARLCEERADYADVVAEKKGSYRIVADGKAFRLSRTALNPKDYKIEPLDGWRKKASADYACLVGPLGQFPGNDSRLYREAVQTNATLLTYIHLQFILSTKNPNKFNYEALWNTSSEIRKSGSAISGDLYWSKVEEALCRCIGASKSDLERFIEKARQHANSQANKEAGYWETEKKKILSLTKEELQAMLLDSQKIQQKIDTIKEKQTKWNKG